MKHRLSSNTGFSLPYALCLLVVVLALVYQIHDGVMNEIEVYQTKQQFYHYQLVRSRAITTATQHVMDGKLSRSETIRVTLDEGLINYRYTRYATGNIDIRISIVYGDIRDTIDLYY